MEEEVAAIDPVVDELGFLAELLDLGRIDLELAEPRGRVDSQDGAQPSLLEMEPVLLGEVGVGHAVAVGDGEMAGVAEVLGGRAADPGPGHGQLAGVGQGHLPVLLVVDRVDL